jgi:hypothetical protein
VLHYPYFETQEPVGEEWDETYAGDGKIVNALSYEWSHGLAEVYNALVGAGLRVTHFQEHRELEWKGLPHMEDLGNGRWCLPEHQRDLAPLMYSIMATRDG